jgi:hypothetical protein
MRKIAERLTALAVVLGLAAGFCGASPIMVNPSFETGDLTGWSATEMAVVRGIASDGQYSLMANPSWSRLPYATDWQSQCDFSQTLTWAPGVTQFSFDIKTANFDASICWIGVGSLNNGSLFQNSFTIDNLPTSVSAAPDGFTRYTCDISGHTDYVTDSPDGGAVLFGIILDLASPTDPALTPAPEFYIDNIQFSTPEPATLSLLALGGLAILRKRVRR